MTEKRSILDVLAYYACNKNRLPEGIIMEKIQFGAGFRNIIHRMRSGNTVSTHGEIQIPHQCIRGNTVSTHDRMRIFSRQRTGKDPLYFSLNNYPLGSFQLQQVERQLRQQGIQDPESVLQHTSAILTILQPKDGHSLRRATLCVNQDGDILNVIGKQVVVRKSNMPGSGYKLINRKPPRYFTNPRFQERFREVWRHHTDAHQAVSDSGNGSNRPIQPPVLKQKYVSPYKVNPLSAEWQPGNSQR